MAYTNNSGTVRRPKMEKLEVDYSLGNAERHCGRRPKTEACGCKFFIVHRDDSPVMCPGCASWLRCRSAGWIAATSTNKRGNRRDGSSPCHVAIATLQRLSVVCHSGDEGELCRQLLNTNQLNYLSAFTSSYLATLDPALTPDLASEAYIAIAMSNQTTT